jgi:transposase
MQYSQELKAKLIEHALRGASTQDVLAEQFGISRSTVQNWMREYRTSGERPLTEKDKRPQSWTTEERLEALLATHGMAEDELGSWCRERGVHTHHLAQWRRELVEGSSQKVSGAADTRALREENRALKKELRRKDKALAETAALLVLSKKVAAIFSKDRGEEE